MPWWSIFTTWGFWVGYIVGFSLATAIAEILNERSNPYGGTILHSFGDVDVVAQRVEKALSELTKWIDKEVRKNVLDNNQTVNEYVYYPVLKHVNVVHVYPSYRYTREKEVMIYIEGLERWKIKRYLKKMV
jgi:hypothetical protein